jgi:hypothetical protein
VNHGYFVWSSIVMATAVYIIQRTIGNQPSLIFDPASSSSLSSSLSSSSITNNNITNRERFRGTQRRNAFEQQRRAMMNRGAGPITESSTETSITNTEIVTHLLSTAPCTITGNTGNMVRSLYRYGHLLILKLKHLLITNAESAYQLEGPHAIPTTSNSLLLSNPQSLGRWLLRLYIAYYFTEERFPTWIHRLTGTNIH